MDTTTTTTSSLTLTELSKRRSKILIVDDEPDISYTLKNVLEQQQVPRYLHQRVMYLII